LHAELYGADHAQVAIVGDFDLAAAVEALERSFGGWKSPSEYVRVEKPFLPIGGAEETILTPDKQMAIVARGTVLRITDDDPDFPALELANYVLGQSSRSRLLNSLRHEGGLSYSAHSFFRVDSKDESGGLVGFAICAPENAGLAQEKLRAEFARWIEKGVSAEELAEGSQGYTKAFDARMADDNFIARQLLDGLENGRTFEYQKKLLERVRSLTPEDVSKTINDHLKQAAFVDIKGGDLEDQTDKKGP
jgi:zinc protease